MERHPFTWSLAARVGIMEHRAGGSNVRNQAHHQSIPGTVLVEGNLVVELEDIGKGLDGDYKRRSASAFHISEIGEKDDGEGLEYASYACQIPRCLGLGN